MNLGIKAPYVTLVRNTTVSEVNVRKFSDCVFVSGQPSADELAAMAAEGFVAVVNLRHDGEPEQIIGVAEEAGIVQSNGMAYHSHPIGGAPLDRAQVAETIAFIDGFAHRGGKVLLHCRKGGRAAAFAAIRDAVATGQTAHEAFARAAAQGSPLDGNLRRLVEQYLSAHPPA